MRILSTFIFLFIAFYSFSQPVDTSKVIVIGNCWGNRPLAPKNILLIDLLKGKLIDLKKETAKKDTLKRQSIISCRLGWYDPSVEPLLILDGVVTELPRFSSISLNDLESIVALKGSTASSLYGYQGSAGVIVVTTKSGSEHKLIIKDFVDDKPIPGATVSFVAADKKDSLLLIANDSGTVITNKLRHSVNYLLTVTAIGYQKIESNFGNGYGDRNQDVFLSRDVKTCETVILTQTICNRTIRCGMYCVCHRTKTRSENSEKDKAVIFKVYPIPAQRGEVLHLQLTNDNDARTIRVVSLEGAKMLEQPINTSQGKAVFQLATDPRWASGIYFIQLLYENGRLAASEKVLLQ